MSRPQAHNLTNRQIDQTYNYFENGGPQPSGVELKKSFTSTMGRHEVSDEKGTRIVND